ncbi:Appr-1-p processing [Cordyceps fumosorosea ARSEF 2679]|uniref:Appr-1-p processing n=1 Tax=Cordyceps fumosorosea (strain ARSEF 2679) TaxID=1081104 RepID=A0A167PBP2_CORFA|nr:Appr-1-p processing [Cordyceps fumosorosea ARSEF 2679]OAA56492.1 Appr-1-p processing [Cordyceps fumosorosea ARSEF 2679]
MSATDFTVQTARLSLRELPPDSHLVHATNCLATWGSGIAAELAKIFPDACRVYKAFCHAARRRAGGEVSRWPPRSLAGQCLVIPPQPGDVARGAPRVHITRASLAAYRRVVDEKMSTTTEAAVAEGPRRQPAAIYSPMFNSGAFRVPWQRTLAAIEEEFAGAKATWTVVLPPTQGSG